MAQFLALLARNYDRYTEADFAPLLEPEAEQARRLYTDGRVRQIWGRKDVLGAVLMVEAATLDEAKAIVETLPLKAKGMLDAQFVELGAYRGFAPRTP